MLKSNVYYRTFMILFTLLPVVYSYYRLTKRIYSKNRATMQEWKDLNLKTSETFYQLAVNLEGLPIKMAQMIAAQADIMPKEVTQTLGQLHDSVPPREYHIIEKQLQKELGKPIEDIFLSIDETALGAASLAQVHKAKLKDGTDVVIKVQYPNIGKIVKADLRAMNIIVQIIKWRLGKDMPFDPAIFIDELGEFLSYELNFNREADSTVRIAKMFEGDEQVRVPKVYEEFSSEKILVLEYLNGVPLSDIKLCKDQGVDLKLVAERIAFLFVEMIFNKGFFHGDPHPGNFLILPDNVVGLLDYGLTKELPEGFGLGMATFMVKAMNEDMDGALVAAKAIGLEMPGGFLNAAILKDMLSGFLGEVNTPMQKKQMKRVAKAKDIKSIQKSIPSMKDVKVPSHLTLVFRTITLLNGLSHQLSPRDRIIQKTLMQTLGPHVMAAAQSSEQ